MKHGFTASALARIVSSVPGARPARFLTALAVIHAACNAWAGLGTSSFSIAGSLSAKTQVMVFFDTEDFTSDRVTPREQLGDMSAFSEMRDFRPRGGWILSPGFKDEYASDRLCWQFWTLRYND